MRPEVRWTVGILVGVAAMTGMLILVFLVALATEPPTWVQVLLGVGLVAGGGFLTWLVAAALGRVHDSSKDNEPSAVIHRYEEGRRNRDELSGRK